VRHARAVDDLEVEVQLITERVERGNIKIFDVEEAP